LGLDRRGRSLLPRGQLARMQLQLEDFPAARHSLSAMLEVTIAPSHRQPIVAAHGCDFERMKGRLHHPDPWQKWQNAMS